MPGTIERVPCKAHDFTIQESGEVIKLAYRWDYQPENAVRIHTPKNKVVKQEKEEEVIIESEIVQ